MRISDWSSDVCSSDLNSTQALVGRAFAKFSGIKEAMVFPLNPPSISSLGIAGGFTFKLQDRAGLGQEALLAARNQLLGVASRSDEHTSELQSLMRISYAVFCLKKKHTYTITLQIC